MHRLYSVRAVALASGLAAAALAACSSASAPPEVAARDQAIVPGTPTHACPAQAGAKPWHGAIGGFNPCSGNLQHTIELGPVTLHYNSLAAGQLGPAGFGTQLGARERLVVEASGAVVRVLADGEELRYVPDGAGGYRSPPETSTRLERPSAGQFIVRSSGGDRRFYTRPSQAAWVMTSYADRVGNTATIAVDSEDRETAIIDAVGNATTLAWAAGRLARVTDAEGLAWQLDYDPAGQLVAVRGPEGAGAPTETFAYDADGLHLLRERRDATGALVGSFEYHADRSAAAWTDATGRRTAIARSGAQVSLTDAFQQVTTYQYSAAGDLVRIVEPSGVTSAVHVYDAQHRITQTTDWLGGITRYAYSPTHDVTSVTDRFGKVTAYTYDANHNVLTVRDPTQRTTAYTYDANDQVLTVRDPSSRLTTYQRAANGNLTSVIGSDGTVRGAFTYGPRGELLTARDADGRVTAYTYDPYLNLASMTSPVGLTEQYQATRLGRPLATTSPAAEQRTWTYDAAHRVSRVAYENGGDAVLVRDAASRITSVTDRGGPTPLAWAATYTADGRYATTSCNEIPDQTSPAGLYAPPITPCVALACADYPGHSGPLSDGCGGTIWCSSGSGSGSGSGIYPEIGE
jgi:YD repeat-containing protein